MCGRNSLFPAAPDLEERFSATFADDAEYEPRYNIAPGTHLEVISDDRAAEIEQFHWGLLPPWADDRGDGIINARSETAHEKPSFRDAWAERPCLVLSSGFYEWKETNGVKRPFRVYKEREPAFPLAGLWEETDLDGETVYSVTILTTEPNELLEPIHDRMPVILSRGDEKVWLKADPEDRRELCQPYREPDLDAYELTTRVNDPSNDDESVIEPADSQQSGLGAFG